MQPEVYHVHICHRFEALDYFCMSTNYNACIYVTWACKKLTAKYTCCHQMVKINNLFSIFLEEYCYIISFWQYRQVVDNILGN